MDVSKQFPALADGTRRAVLEALAQQPRSVGEIAANLPVSRPAVSQHLKVLQDAGLVHSTREGARNIYQVDYDGLAAMRTYLDALWSEALNNLKSVSEDTYKPDATRNKNDR